MQENVEVDERQLARVVAALRAEADGKQLAKDLVTDLKRVAEPAMEAARAAILSMPVSGRHHMAPGLRETVAARTTVTVRLSGQHPGVAIKASKSGMPRGFRNAPKRLQSRSGWRHKVFGRDRWVVQIGRPGWFDDTIKPFKPAAERGAAAALDKVAQRIDRRTKG